MTDSEPGAPPPAPETPSHPTGTLAIVAIYGLLFAAGWLAVYLFIYRARGGIFE